MESDEQRHYANAIHMLYCGLKGYMNVIYTELARACAVITGSIIFVFDFSVPVMVAPVVPVQPVSGAPVCLFVCLYMSSQYFVASFLLFTLLVPPAEYHHRDSQRLVCFRWP